MMEDEKVNMRYVVVGGVLYLHFKDVAEYIRATGSCEETDVRNRQKAAAEHILKMNDSK